MLQIMVYVEISKLLNDNIIEKAFDKAEFINLPKVEQDKYHQNLKVYRDATKVGCCASQHRQIEIQQTMDILNRKIR